MSGKVKAYAHFGVILKNEQWSWSGRAADRRVVLSIWKEQIDYSAKPPRVDLLGDARLSIWQSKPGNRERIENLKWARDHQYGIFHVVIVTAVDYAAEPRVILEAYPTKLTMRLIDFDENSGEFSAQVVQGTNA